MWLWLSLGQQQQDGRWAGPGARQTWVPVLTQLLNDSCVREDTPTQPVSSFVNPREEQGALPGLLWGIHAGEVLRMGLALSAPLLALTSLPPPGPL